MAGALPVVSGATPYGGWRGRLPMADSPVGFVEQVKWAVGNRELVRELAAGVRELVLAERTVERNVWR